MKYRTLLATAAFLGLLAVAQSAAANEELAKKNNCLVCHAVDKKVVGPAYKEVAAKYKGNADAPALLADKIKKGGTGVWGQIPMPPNPNVSDDDIKALVSWILAL